MRKSALIIAAAGLALGAPAPIFAASETENSWSQHWQKLESDLDKVFHDSVAKLRPGPTRDTQTYSSSVDVRENDQAYVARIYLPQSDESKLNATYSDGSLHLSSTDKAFGAYEQDIAIPGPVQADKMKVEHKNGIVVVTLPKKPGSTATNNAMAPAEPLTEGWDRQIVREMQRMQSEMDRMTHDMFASFPDTDAWGQQQFVDSSVNVEDQKDKYIVHFYLPDTKLTNIKADLKNEQLQLTATAQTKNETKDYNGSSSEYSAGEFSQLITLPGPVHGDQMKIDRKEGVVTVTLPKA